MKSLEIDPTIKKRSIPILSIACNLNVRFCIVLISLLHNIFSIHNTPLKNSAIALPDVGWPASEMMSHICFFICDYPLSEQLELLLPQAATL